MLYKKVNLELIVVADEAEHPGTRRRSALAHTKAAGESVAVAARAARESVKVDLRTVL